MDLGDHRLGHLLGGGAGRDPLAPEGAQHLDPAGEVGELPEVDPGGEHRSLAAQHDHPHLGVGGGLAERIAQRPDQLEVERVALLRPVEDEVADRPAIFS